MGARGATRPRRVLAVHQVSVAPARRAALRALARIRKDEAFSGPVLSAELRRAHLSAEDVALATRLTYGTLSAEGVLDEAIDRYAKGGLEPQVRDALRLAAFEMLFGRAPTYAVVDQAVESVRASRPRAAGMANAVLRRIAETAADFPWGDPGRDRDALARATGHPRWICDLVLEDLGDAAGREMLAAGMESAPTYVRLDPFAADRESVLRSLAAAEPEPSPPDSDCFRLERPSAAFGSGPARGWFSMDAAAQIAPAACRPKPGLRLLDVGAGRGNKTVCLQAIAMRAGGPASILAVDVHATKVSALGARLAESGVPGVEAQVADASHLGEDVGQETFDVVLLDAPCSGLGTLRRYPEKRWRLTPAEPERMADLQLAMLEACAGAVRAGGCVVYSTCSVAHQENDGVVDAFMAGERGTSFRLERIDDLVPSEWGKFRTARGCFQSWPASGGPDGHYVAVCRRNDG